MDRRRFLSLSTFYTVAVATGMVSACGSDEDGSGNTAPSMPTGTFAFAEGVASGDPRDTSAVFWTRCTWGSGATSQGSVPMTLQVSTTQAFSQLIASVPLTAVPDFDWTVRA